jgi:hypothetical protein
LPERPLPLPGFADDPPGFEDEDDEGPVLVAFPRLPPLLLLPPLPPLPLLLPVLESPPVAWLGGVWSSPPVSWVAPLGGLAEAVAAGGG